MTTGGQAASWGQLSTNGEVSRRAAALRRQGTCTAQNRELSATSSLTLAKRQKVDSDHWSVGPSSWTCRCVVHWMCGNTYPVSLEGTEGALPGQAGPRQCRCLGPLLTIQRRLLPAQSPVSIPGQKKGMRTKARMGHRVFLLSWKFHPGRRAGLLSTPANISLATVTLPGNSGPEVGWPRHCRPSVRPRADQA